MAAATWSSAAGSAQRFTPSASWGGFSCTTALAGAGHDGDGMAWRVSDGSLRGSSGHFREGRTGPLQDGTRKVAASHPLPPIVCGQSTQHFPEMLNALPSSKSTPANLLFRINLNDF